MSSVVVVSGGQIFTQPSLHLSQAEGKTKHVVFKVKDWDPTKHPKGYKGLFIETPDKQKIAHANAGDVVASKNGKTFHVEKVTPKGVKVNPIDNDTGEVKESFTVLNHDTEIATIEKSKPVGASGPVSEMSPGTHIQTAKGKKFKISKHGKWTTVYPIDDTGKVTGKHTVLPPDTDVKVIAPDDTADPGSIAVKEAMTQVHVEVEKAKGKPIWDNGQAVVDFRAQMAGDLLQYGKINPEFTKKALDSQIAATEINSEFEPNINSFLGDLDNVMEQAGAPLLNGEEEQKVRELWENAMEYVQMERMLGKYGGDDSGSEVSPKLTEKPMLQMTPEFYYQLTEETWYEISEIYTKDDEGPEAWASNALVEINQIGDKDSFVAYAMNWDVSEEAAAKVWDKVAAENMAAPEFTTEAKVIEEVLPQKLPKVPRKYPPGAGKDTHILVESGVLVDDFRVFRIDAAGNRQQLGVAMSKTAAYRVARQGSAPHEEIRHAISTEDYNFYREYDYKPGMLVIDSAGKVQKIQEVLEVEKQTAVGPQTERVVRIKALGPNGEWLDEPQTTVISKYVDGQIQTIENPAEYNPVHSRFVPMGPGEHGWPSYTYKTPTYGSPYWGLDNQQIDGGLANGGKTIGPNQIIREQKLAAGIIKTNDSVIRAERANKYLPQLQADWQLDTLAGSSVNGALKTLNKLGYREIKPRQKDVVRVINGNGKRIVMGRDGNHITDVTESSAGIVGVITGKDLHGQLAETLATGGDISSLDPFGDGTPLIHRTSHVQQLLYDMAVGETNKIAVTLGKNENGKDVVVKSDDAYRKEIEEDGIVADTLDILLELPDPERTVNARGSIVERFGLNNDPNWDFTNKKMTVPPEFTNDEAAALGAILWTHVAANHVLQPDSSENVAVTPENGWDPNLKSDDLFEAAKKLSATLPALSPHITGDDQTRIDNAFQKAATDLKNQADTKNEKQLEIAESMRNQIIQDEIDERRAVEGTVKEQNQIFDLPTWGEIEMQPQTWDDIHAEIAIVEGQKASDDPNPLVGDIYQYDKDFYHIDSVNGSDEFVAHRVTWSAHPVNKYVDAEEGPFTTQLDGLGTLVIRPPVSESIPADIPAFYDAGYLKDGLMYHRSTETHTEIPLEADQQVIDVLVQQGAIEGGVIDPLNPGYQGSGNLSDGVSLQIKTPATGPTGEPQSITFVKSNVHDNQNVAVDAESTQRIEAALDSVGMSIDNQSTFFAGLVAISNTYPTDTEDQIKQFAEKFDPKLYQRMTGQVVPTDKSIEYIHHQQASGTSGGAPTSQRGRFILRGYTPEEAHMKLQELGLVGNLEPEVPFKSVLRGTRRHGALTPMLPAYVRGEAELPKAPAKITHGATASGGISIDSLNAILDSGGLLSIAERHRVGIKVHTTSPAGDIRSGIDHAVFCTLNGGGACGSGSKIKFIMKPSAFLRRDIVLAPQDFGGSETRYAAYKSYLNKLQTEVGEAKTNIYEPISPAVRQRHLNSVNASNSNEFNLGPSVPIEDMEAIVVPEESVDQINQKLDAMLKNGQIVSRPRIISGGEYNPGSDTAMPTGSKTGANAV